MDYFKDERIKSQTHKIGNESFFILVVMLFITLIYKTIVNGGDPKSFPYELALIAISCSYYTIRSIFSGVYTTPSKPKERSRLVKFLFLCSFIGSLIWGLFVAIRNMFLYQGGVFDWLTVAIFLISSISFFALLFVAFIAIYSVSGIHSRKIKEE